MARLFVAIDLPESVCEQLAAISNGLPGARWTRDLQFHLTLRFIGEVDGPRQRLIADALHGVRADPFELSLRGVGHFPPRGPPRVLWAGLDGEGSQELAHLHQEVERVLKRAGLPAEERKFSAHVTLARLDGTPLERVLGFLARHVDLRSEPFPVTSILLYSSVLSAGGALHTIEAAYPLFARTS